MAIAGIVLGALGLLSWVLMVVFFAVGVNEAKKDCNERPNDPSIAQSCQNLRDNGVID